jgi:hypothetical protein
MAPCSFVDFYDDRETHITNACFSDTLGGIIFQSKNKTIIMDLRSDYDKALDELNREFPNIDIAPLLLNNSFAPKNTMADTFQNIRYEFLLFLRELFR